MSVESDINNLSVPVPPRFSCGCDFCTGKKRWSDNWCPRCGQVQMQPPKWWENLDVCDACEVETAKEAAEPETPR